MDFGKALSDLKNGHKVARTDWKSSQFLLLIKPENYSVKVNFELIDGPLLPFIGIKLRDNYFVPWIPGQIDLLANDWRSINE